MNDIDIICCGHAAYDLIYPLPGYPEENRKYQIPEMETSGGGPAANAAVLLAKWGIATAFAGVVGTDPFAQFIIDEFTEHHVDTSMLEQRHGYPTPVSCILSNSTSGSRTILNRRNPGMACRLLEDLPWKPKVLLFDSHELESSLALMDRYPQAVTVLDAGSLRKGSRVLGERVDYLIGSADFASQYAGLPDLKTREQREEALNKLAELNPRNSIITLGAEGLIYMLNGQMMELPAMSVNPLDTTAAGDIFHGAFAYGMVTGWSMRKALELATCAAGLSVQRPGGRRSIPTLAEVQTMLPGYHALLQA